MSKLSQLAWFSSLGSMVHSLRDGFESPSGDHWLGNDKIHDLTTQKTYQLRVDLTNSAGSQYYALYSTFSIGDEDNKYTLSTGTYSGDSGYDSMSFSSGDPFSTHDGDNDGTAGETVQRSIEVPGGTRIVIIIIITTVIGGGKEAITTIALILTSTETTSTATTAESSGMFFLGAIAASRVQQ
ncbi:putative ryncolin-1-like [Apostichopus japonicus]|uniref:Putative ryncolin-1-like n=1 Tax=Stichopus japonicus TaxID=307972 RepID=A0A2G8KEG4_STIJA|nr:putative ryncolin-1-like [Apostichopus japonicus]